LFPCTAGPAFSHTSVVLSTLQQEDALVRKWTDNTGKHSVLAELAEVVDGKATIKKQDGELVTPPLAKLSDADSRYLKTVISLRSEPLPPAPLETSVKFERSLKTLLKKYCIRCHNADEQSCVARFDQDY